MKKLRIEENDSVNKGGLAAGDQMVVEALRTVLANAGFSVTDKIAIETSEAGYMTFYQPPPALGLLRHVRRFSFREMTDSDHQYQDRLNQVFKKKGFAKLRRWSEKENRMVTEDVSMAALRNVMPPPMNDPATGLPIIG